MLNSILVFISGSIFGLGLVISEMTNPEKVRSFLRMFGNWDPSLIFVMFSAIMISAPIFWVLQQKNFHKSLILKMDSNHKIINSRLIIGAGLFGMGWGIVGFCPGPVVSSLSFGQISSFIFLIAMVAGFIMSRFIKISR